MSRNNFFGLWQCHNFSNKDLFPLWRELRWNARHCPNQELMMRKRSPTHPGRILREGIFAKFGRQSHSVSAHSLVASRQTLHAVLAEHSGVSAEKA